MSASTTASDEEHEYRRGHVDAHKVVFALVSPAGCPPVVHQPGAEKPEGGAVGAQHRVEGVVLEERGHVERHGQRGAGRPGQDEHQRRRDGAEAPLDQRAEDPRSRSTTNW